MNDVVEMLRSCFVVVDGVIFHRERPAEMFKSEAFMRSWNRLYSGRCAEHTNKVTGYKYVVFRDKKIYSHRVAWMIHYGIEISGSEQIDHIDHNRSNNKIENLRVVSVGENKKNLSRYITNSSGVAGVSFDRARNKWKAAINLNGKTINIGRFNTKEEAAEARKIKEIELGFHKNHGE